MGLIEVVRRVFVDVVLIVAAFVAAPRMVAVAVVDMAALLVVHPLGVADIQVDINNNHVVMVKVPQVTANLPMLPVADISLDMHLPLQPPLMDRVHQSDISNLKMATNSLNSQFSINQVQGINNHQRRLRMVNNLHQPLMGSSRQRTQVLRLALQLQEDMHQQPRQHIQLTIRNNLPIQLKLHLTNNNQRNRMRLRLLQLPLVVRRLEHHQDMDPPPNLDQLQDTLLTKVLAVYICK